MIPNSRPARIARSGRTLASGAAIMVLALAGTSALAQGTPEARLDKVESEVRALQRKVFPGPDGKYFEPQVTTGGTSAPTTATPPATTAVTDLLTRMDSVEAQMRQLTSQVEQNTNRINLLEAKLGSQAMAPASTPASSPAAVAPGFTTTSTQTAVSPSTPPPAPAVVTKPAVTPAPAPVTKPAAPTSARVEAVKAIVKPQTADLADDEYSYGFRLWEAKFYPEAEQQLKAYIQKYPKHARVSYARNLLGRAYLDEGNASEGAKWFWQNYLADKRGDRAPDSLLYLAVSMKQLNDTNRACIALAEFSETYASEAAGRLKSTYDSTRSGLACK